LTVDTSKYPELADINEWLKSRWLKLEDVLTPDALESIKSEVVALLEGKSPPEFSKDSELRFFLTLVIIKILGIKSLLQRFLDGERERLIRLLERETEENVFDIARALGLNMERVRSDVTRKSSKVVLVARIGFVEYLTATRGVNEERLSLKYRVMKDGYVYLSKEELALLLANLLIERGRRIYEMINEAAMPEALKNLAKGLKVKRFPPCMDALMSKQRLNEDEAANLAAFLLSVGFSKKDVVELMVQKGLDNAEQLVESLVPKPKRAYIPENCESLKRKGICVADCKVRNPLQYYFGSLK